jgi:hypothetical protein
MTSTIKEIPASADTPADQPCKTWHVSYRLTSKSPVLPISDTSCSLDEAVLEFQAWRSANGIGDYYSVTFEEV